MKISDVAKNSFWQLLVIYTLAVFIIALGFFSKYALYYNILALIIALFGIFLTKNSFVENQNPNNKILNLLFWFSILIILLTRLIPYFLNGFEFPLGYDAGMYKYAIEHGLQKRDMWVLGGVEPGFLYLFHFLNLFLSTNFLLIYLFIIINLVLGLSIYFFSKEYFNREIAVFSILIYSLSLAQFNVFTLLYIKNIIGIGLILVSFIFIRRKKYLPFILSGIILAGIHRPSFYIFGLSYFVFVLSLLFRKTDNKYTPSIDSSNSDSLYINYKSSERNNNKREGSYDNTSPRGRDIYNPINVNTTNNNRIQVNTFFRHVLYGILILVFSSLFYIGDFKIAILSLISPVLSSFVETGVSPGTFISFSEYQFLSLFYLPFAFLGLFYLFQKKKFDIFLFYGILTILIVYFQFFFYNRFVIFLDIFFIITSAIGIYLIINSPNTKKKLGLILISLLLLSGFIFISKAVIETKPLISDEILDSIKQIDVPYVISTTSLHSPFLQGWANAKVIAPGMFDYDIWQSKDRWIQFQEDLNASELKTEYKEDIYLFTNKPLNHPCYEFSGKNLYKWIC